MTGHGVRLGPADGRRGHGLVRESPGLGRPEALRLPRPPIVLGAQPALPAAAGDIRVPSLVAVFRPPGDGAVPPVLADFHGSSPCLRQIGGYATLPPKALRDRGKGQMMAEGMRRVIARDGMLSSVPTQDEYDFLKYLRKERGYGKGFPVR